MAGGTGTRFWPKSRAKFPKQFLKIFGNETMIQATYQRLRGLANPKEIFIVTNADQSAETQRQLFELSEKNIIIEPFGKNTAPCIGLSAIFIKQLNPEAVMFVLPADHIVKDINKFHTVVKAGEKVALEKNCLVTIGIQPTRPETGYGYIQYDSDTKYHQAYKVRTFAEKPNLETAKKFLESGDFLWNSGMFVWKVSVILKEIEEHLPELYDGLMEIEKNINSPNFSQMLSKVYAQVKSISIDYGVMEQAKEVYVLKADFDWSDVGSWEEVYNMSPKNENGNISSGENHILINTKNCLISTSTEKTIATVGVEDLIIVDTEDALLICKKNQSQNVKQVVEILNKKNITKLL
jgi:mannose-1-phosphate guanylyltransferase